MIPSDRLSSNPVIKLGRIKLDDGHINIPGYVSGDIYQYVIWDDGMMVHPCSLQGFSELYHLGYSLGNIEAFNIEKVPSWALTPDSEYVERVFGSDSIYPYHFRKWHWVEDQIAEFDCDDDVQYSNISGVDFFTVADRFVSTERDLDAPFAEHLKEVIDNFLEYVQGNGGFHSLLNEFF